MGTPGSLIHFVPGLDPELGGISSTVPRLIAALRNTDAKRVEVVSFSASSSWDHADTAGARTQFLQWPSWAAANRILFPNSETGILRGVGIVHVHGLWTPLTAIVLWKARRMGIPYVMSAHGMLDSWALGQKAARKRAYYRTVEGLNLAGAACLHALTSTEAEDYRRVGLRGPIMIIPNGVDIQPQVEPAVLLRRFPQLVGKRIVLFMSRVHQKKGLDLLIRAWGALQKHHPDAHLLIAGPDSDGTLTSLQEMVGNMELTSSVTFAGMLTGDIKWSALNHAHVFVLPSRSEGFSAALLESLACGTPVAITRQCSFSAVTEAGAGWISEPVAGQIEKNLDAALSLTPECHDRMRSVARSLAADYGWPMIAAQFAALYAWIVGGPRPAGIEIA